MAAPVGAPNRPIACQLSAQRICQPSVPVAPPWCLTPRSSRAPTACRAGPAGGTRYIFAIRARASHRRCRLNSNVRRHQNHPPVCPRSLSFSGSSLKTKAAYRPSIQLVRFEKCFGFAKPAASPSRLPAPCRWQSARGIPGGSAGSEPVVPNPSFKPSPNGVPRGPGRRYAVHFRQPGPRVTPLVPA